MNAAQLADVVHEADELVHRARAEALVMIREASVARLGAMQHEIEDLDSGAKSLQELYDELKGIVVEYTTRVPGLVRIGDHDDKAFADALDVVVKALLRAEGGLITDAATMMKFDLTKLTLKHPTIRKAAIEFGIGQSSCEDQFKAFTQKLPQHDHVETIADPDVSDIVLAVAKGMPGRTPRGNPLDTKIKKLHLEYKTRESKSKRVRTD